MRPCQTGRGHGAGSALRKWRWPIDPGVVAGVVAAAAITMTWAILLGVLCGVGRSLARVLMPGMAVGLVTSCWLGLSVFLGYVLVWHLLLPASGWVWIPPTLVALLEAWRARARLARRRAWARSVGATYWLGALAVALAALWLANLSIQPPFHYDSGLYHLQAVQWSGTHAAVPGLANLHYRLGFTSAWWPFTSSLGLGPWRGHEAHLATGLVLCLLLAEQARCAVALARRRSTRPDLVLGVLLLPVTLSQISFGWVSSPAYDQPLYAMAVATSIYLLRTLVSEPRLAPVVVLLATATVLVRLQAAPFSLAACAIVLCAAVRAPRERRLRLGELAIAAGAASVGVVAYVATGVIGSGYPFFPLPVAGVAVDWRVPDDVASGVQQNILDVARGAPSGTEGWSWFVPWIRLNGGLSTFRYGLGLLAVATSVILICGVATVWRRSVRGAAASVALCFAAALLGLLAWFITSPDPRLGMGAIWVAAGTATVLALELMRAWPRLRLASVTAVLVVLSAQAGWALVGSGQLWPKLAVGAGPVGVIAPPIPAYHEARSPAVYNVPDVGDQCWDVPIPCAEAEHPGLEQRGQDLSDGYRMR